MADTSASGSRNNTELTLAAAAAVGELWQLPDGRAGALVGRAGSSGQTKAFTDTGKFTCTKTAGFVGLRGNRAYWDHSANSVYYKKVNDRDFYIGRFVNDAASGDTTCTVDLNVDPRYDIDLNLDPFLSTTVGTAAAGGLGYPVRLGGAHVLELTATNEAQKTDLLSADGFAIGSNAIIEFAFRVLSDGASGSQDFTIGCASGTHASDFQSVAEFVAVHLDGNDTAIYAESDDGTTDNAPATTSTSYTEGSAVANRVEGWIDLRDPTDAQVYINGSNVLPSSTFTLAAASGPLFLVAHLEKSAGTDTYKLAVDWLRARLMEQ